jgi:hypothetical protein
VSHCFHCIVSHFFHCIVSHCFQVEWSATGRSGASLAHLGGSGYAAAAAPRAASRCVCVLVGAFLRACARRWQLNAVISVTSHDASVPPPHSARVQAGADDGCSLGQGVASRARQPRELPPNIEFKHRRMKLEQVRGEQQRRRLERRALAGRGLRRSVMHATGFQLNGADNTGVGHFAGVSSFWFAACDV